MPYRILHIPKTGGTVLKRSLIDDYTKQELKDKYMQTRIKGLYFCSHLVHLDEKASKYENIFFVRDPVDRFVSHFVFYMRGGEGFYDTDKFMERRRLKFPHAAVAKFKNVNQMAERMGKAKKLKMKKLAWDIDYILGGIESVRKYRENIFYVGRMEYLEEDFQTLQKRLGIKNTLPLARDLTNVRSPALDSMAALTDDSRAILRNYFDDEYKIIDYLKKEGLLPKDYLNER